MEKLNSSRIGRWTITVEPDSRSIQIFRDLHPDFPAVLQTKDYRGRLLLHDAAIYNQPAAAELYLQRMKNEGPLTIASISAVVLCKDFDNNTPLQLATIAGSWAVLDLLLNCLGEVCRLSS